MVQSIGANGEVLRTVDRVGLIFFIGWIVAFLLRVIRKTSQRAGTGTYTRSQSRWGPNPWGNSSQQYRSSYDVLGVSPNASREEVSAAYRRPVQQYHPDKVADLGPELRELAEQRMKEINSAYESLKRQNSR